jgi:hypothetical protein
MTFDEYMRARGRGAPAELYRKTGVSAPTLRKVKARLPVSADVAHKLADFLGCDWQLFTKPRPRRRLAKKARA